MKYKKLVETQIYKKELSEEYHIHVDFPIHANAKAALNSIITGVSEKIDNTFWESSKASYVKYIDAYNFEFNNNKKELRRPIAKRQKNKIDKKIFPRFFDTNFLIP